ncbi:hypothetical protein DFQ26_002753 [Actinomortierella ambigua]|nr:hypothetical protein DFQ26_002753 [Actinomortierella ambigua]
MPLVGALESVAQLALVLGFGGLLASFGYLNPSTQIALYRLTQVFLTPVLIYFSIAFTSFRLEDVLAHWHLALYFLTLVPLVTLVSWAVVRLASFSRVDCQWIAASILFQDSTCLPLTVVQALANSVMGLHLLLQGPSDTRQGVLARGVGSRHQQLFEMERQSNALVTKTTTKATIPPAESLLILLFIHMVLDLSPTPAGTATTTTGAFIHLSPPFRTRP